MGKRTEDMKAAIQNQKKPQVASPATTTPPVPSPPPESVPPKPAKSVKPEFQPKKRKLRSLAKFTAEMLAAREKANGRLPVGTLMSCRWTGTTWEFTMTLVSPDGEEVKRIANSRSSLWSGLEFMDYHFWHWWVQAGDERQGKLTFASQHE